MNPTCEFFSRLRKLAVTLETEAAQLQQTFENRHNDDEETTARAMRAYHDLNCDVRSLKDQIQDHLKQQKTRENEVSSFIKSYREMEQKVSEDIKTLRTHWEKYGYQAPKDGQRPNATCAEARGQEVQMEGAAANEDDSAVEEESHEEAGTSPSSASSPKVGQPPFADSMRTPKLADFGLSEVQLKKNLAGSGKWASEVPQMPKMSLPQPTLDTPAPPPMPLTPKCALKMDEDELLTPQMHDFGITEDTMCFNNDFTMDLFRKRTEKPLSRPAQDLHAQQVNSLMESLQTKADNFESPEPPVFCTPGFKLKKTKSHSSPPSQGDKDLKSPGCLANIPTTPEVPAFQTPHMHRLVSNKKSVRPSEPMDAQPDDKHTFDLPTPRHNGATGSKRSWEYNVPELSIPGVEDKQMPEMPNLESFLGNSLQCGSAKVPKKVSEFGMVSKPPNIPSVEVDGPTQEFSLGTPQIRREYQEPSTPEMPDLSSVTQDICKLLSQAQSKKAAVVHPQVRQEKENSPFPTVRTLSLVSESEFQSLPSYLRQMTLHNLNQAVHNINTFITQNQGDKTEFQMEDLRKITNVGTKAPIYILCLNELHRLEHVRGTRTTSVYKLNPLD